MRTTSHTTRILNIFGGEIYFRRPREAAENSHTIFGGLFLAAENKAIFGGYSKPPKIAHLFSAATLKPPKISELFSAAGGRRKLV
jgi:hypothetical protein